LDISKKKIEGCNTTKLAHTRNITD